MTLVMGAAVVTFMFVACLAASFLMTVLDWRRNSWLTRLANVTLVGTMICLTLACGRITYLTAVWLL